jgi:hypothetical protein
VGSVQNQTHKPQFFPQGNSFRWTKKKQARFLPQLPQNMFDLRIPVQTLVITMAAHTVPFQSIHRNVTVEKIKIKLRKSEKSRKT